MKTHLQDGYSILELIVCLAILGGTLGAALEIWSYATRVGTATSHSMLDSSPAPLARHLRRDVQATSRLPDGGPSWSTGPLTLDSSDRSSVTYKVRRGDLWRIGRTATGATTSRRLASGVTDWRWRAVSADLVEIRIDLSVHPDPVSAASSTAPAGTVALEHETTTIRLCRRGGGGGTRW